MKLNDGVAKRFKEVSQESGLTTRAFAKSLNCPPSTIHEIFAGRVKMLPESILTRLESSHSINRRWLETGRCPKYKQSFYKSYFQKQGLLSLFRLLCKEKQHMLPSVLKKNKSRL